MKAQTQQQAEDHEPWVQDICCLVLLLVFAIGVSFAIFLAPTEILIGILGLLLFVSFIIALSHSINNKSI